jgi:mRNA-degrading endonuclease RelE of RelBE toxin-antitoxin system
MRYQATRRFERTFSDLPDEDAERVRKALRLLAENPRHPSLQAKRIQGTEGIWEARAGLAIRLTYETRSDLIILRNVGLHDATLKKP